MYHGHVIKTGAQRSRTVLMTESQSTPPRPPMRDRDDERAREAEDERFALKAMLALFALAGLIIAVVTIFGGGVGD